MRTRVCLLAIIALTLSVVGVGCSYDLGGAEAASRRKGGEFTPLHEPVPMDAYVVKEDAGPPPRDAGPPACPDAGVAPPPPPGRCWITGGGQIDGETLGGNAKPFRDGSVGGHWNHVDHEGGHLNANPDTIVLCDFVGPPEASPPSVEFNRIIFEGTGTWAERGGDTIPVTFQVIVIDHGEPEEDVYTLMVFSGTTLIHSISGDLDRGNLQIHPSNPGHP